MNSAQWIALISIVVFNFVVGFYVPPKYTVPYLAYCFFSGMAVMAVTTALST